MKRLLLLLLFLGATAPRTFAQAPPKNTWAGALQIQGVALTIRVHFTRTAEALQATIDIPQQGAEGLPLSNVRYDAPKVHFELPAGPGLAVFDGVVQEDGTITGTITQAGVAGTFQLAKVVEKKE